MGIKKSDSYINILRLGIKDVVSVNEIPIIGQVKAMVKENIESPEEMLEELHRLYNSDSNLSNNDFLIMACYAAYLNDPSFALNALERSANLQNSGLFFIWAPIMEDVRKLPRFKEFLREIGLVDYWSEFGWPDFCRKVGNSDFECD